MRSGLLLSFVAFAATPAIALAQEVQDTTRIEELVVTATKAPTPADAVVSTVTTITGEELRTRGIRLVQDALRGVPGAGVVQVGSYLSLIHI